MTSLLKVYTDGSCHPPSGTGAWAAYYRLGKRDRTLSKVHRNTTHQQMELRAVIEVLQHLREEGMHFPIRIYTDSQYVYQLPEREPRLRDREFRNKSGEKLPNHSLLIEFFKHYHDQFPQLIPVDGHPKATSLHHKNIRYVDQLARKLAREAIQ